MAASKEIDAVMAEKQALQKRVQTMEQQLLKGGTDIEEQPEFQTAVEKARLKVEFLMKTEYDRKMDELKEQLARALALSQRRVPRRPRAWCRCGRGRRRDPLARDPPNTRPPALLH